MSNIYTSRSDSLCQYKRHDKSNIIVYHKTTSGLVLFSYKDMKISSSCLTVNGPRMYSRVINGSVLIDAYDQCVVKTEYFQFSHEQFQKEIDLEDKYPEISCCSPFYLPNEKVVTTTEATIQLNNFQDIKAIDGNLINLDMHRLMKFGKENFPQFDEDNPKYFNIYIAGFILLVILFIVYKFQHLIMFCCKRSRRVEERPHEVRQASAPVLERAIVYVPDVGVKFNHV